MEDVRTTVDGLAMNSNWEDRQHLLDPEHIVVGLSLDKRIRAELTQEEFERTMSKFAQLKPFIQQLCLRMLKGTIKYSTDVHTPEEYRKEFGSELADVVCYHILGLGPVET